MTTKLVKKKGAVTMFRGKVVNFPTGCTLSLSLFFSFQVIIPAIDNLISELLQFRWCNGEGGGGC